jgi:hypothetical protein
MHAYTYSPTEYKSTEVPISKLSLTKVGYKLHLTRPTFTVDTTEYHF